MATTVSWQLHMVPTAVCCSGCARANIWGAGGLRPSVRQHEGWESLAPSTKEGKRYCPVWLNYVHWRCTQRLSTATPSPAELLYSKVQSLTGVLQVPCLVGSALLETLSQQEASQRGVGTGVAAGVQRQEAS